MLALFKQNTHTHKKRFCVKHTPATFFFFVLLSIPSQYSEEGEVRIEKQNTKNNQTSDYKKKQHFWFGDTLELRTTSRRTENRYKCLCKMLANI